MQFNALNDLELETIENCICLESREYLLSSYELKVNIPKLMPLIPVNHPTTDTVHINKSIIKNNRNTFPVVSGSVRSCNYIVATKARLSMYDMSVELGTTISALIKNKNIKDIKYAII